MSASPIYIFDSLTYFLMKTIVFQIKMYTSLNVSPWAPQNLCQLPPIYIFDALTYFQMKTIVFQCEMYTSLNVSPWVFKHLWQLPPFIFLVILTYFNKNKCFQIKCTPAWMWANGSLKIYASFTTFIFLIL